MAKYSGDQYISVEIEAFEVNATLPCNIYIYLPLNDRIVLLRHTQDIFDLTLLEFLKKKSLTQVYVQKEDFSKYAKQFKSPSTKEISDLLESLESSAPQELPDSPPNSIDTQSPLPEDLHVNKNFENIPFENTIQNQTVPSPEKITTLDTEPEFLPNTRIEPSIVSDLHPNLSPAHRALSLALPARVPAVHSPATMIENGIQSIKTEFKINSATAKGMVNELFMFHTSATEEPILKKAKDYVKQIYEQTKDGGINLLELLDCPAIEHSTTVATFSAVFATALGYHDKTVLRDLTLAGFIHDLGITQIDSSAYQKPLLLRNKNQQQEYETHVQKGIDVLNFLEFKLNKRVLNILKQQHEKFDGTGYPENLEGFQIDELAQVLCLADLIDTISRGWYDGFHHSIAESFKILETIEDDPTFPHYFNPDLLRKILNMVPH